MIIPRLPMCRHNYAVKRSDCIYFVSWISGLLLGIAISGKAPSNILTMMRSSIFGRVSIVWVLVSAAFPYFLFFVSRCFLGNRVIPVFLFLKAFCYAYCLGVVFCAFGSAGWLVGLISSVSDTVPSLLFLLFLFSFNELKVQKYCVFAAINILVVISMLCIDRYILWPYWSRLI